MTYAEVIDYLFHQFPQYQRIGASAYKPGLHQISQLCDIIGNPQKELTFIHVAGTNGKGSTCNMLASILAESGYKVGLFTSPHLIDFRERIRVNGEMITEQQVVDFVIQYKNSFEKVQASFFEWSTALAFHHFLQSAVDIVVLETGMGGRLDSTNIVTPVISAITPIGMDHVQFLGDTIEEIAGEKAGIIKTNVPCVVASGNEEIKHVFEKKAEIMSAPLYVVKNPVDENISSMLGDYQRINIATVEKIIELLNCTVNYKISQESFIKGLQNVQKNTGFRGRWELLQKQPDCIADIAHNVEGVKQMMIQLSLVRKNYKKVHIVWGMVSDKDIIKVVQLLPEDAQYYLSAPKIARAYPVDELKVFFQSSFDCTAYSSCCQAFEEAKKRADEEDLVLIGGSNFVVAEIIEKFFNNNLQA
jgi:dihydrofolate synthase / folylpolyglutamate synthase